MIEDTLEKIEARIKESKSISEEKRRELQDLLGKLRNEVSNLAETSPEQAESITNLADISTSEATRRDEKNPAVLNEALGGLEKSIEAEVPAELTALLEERQAVRKAKDFKRSDAIRDELKAKGWVIEDTPKGPRLKRI